MIIAIITLSVHAASAETPHPTIGQIQASGAAADDEFVVLQNPTEQSVDIGSWSIQYKSASGATYYKKNFVKGAAIGANANYVVCGKDFSGACDMKHSSFSLSSSGGTVFIVSNQIILASSDSTAIVDQKTYSADAAPVSPLPSPPAGEGAVLTTAPKQTDAIKITINELMPAPTDGNEWIELYDGTGYAVDLAGWTLADGTGKNFMTLDGLILPTQYKLIELPSSRLNNSGDLITLRDTDKKEIDRVAFGDWDNDIANAPVGGDGVAIARLGDGVDSNRDNYDFALSRTPTPGAANTITAPSGNNQEPRTNFQISSKNQSLNSKTDTQWLVDLLSKQSDEIAKLLKADNVIIINNLVINPAETKPLATATVSKTAAAPKTTVAKTTTAAATKTTATKPANTAEGMVIVPTGVVGKDICVVRETNRSVEVRLPSDLKQSPVAGDIIKTSGSWSTAKTLTLPRLLVKKGAPVAIMSHDTPPAPLNIFMNQLNDHVGKIISTSGTIVEKQPTRLRIADGSASLLIKTNFEAAKGEKISATGLLVKSDPDLLLTALAPDALAIIKPPTKLAPSFAKKVMPYGLAALPAGILAGTAFFGRRMKKRKGVNANER